MKTPYRFAVALFATIALMALFATALFVFAPAVLAAQTTASGGGFDSEAARMVFLAAAIATGLATLGAGFAVARVGAAAVGALAEKPELFGRLLILVGLAEGIAIYGLIVSILILNRLG
jgi:V/A-type H+-transporting ATPase subunit K